MKMLKSAIVLILSVSFGLSGCVTKSTSPSGTEVKLASSDDFDATFLHYCKDYLSSRNTVETFMSHDRVFPNDEFKVYKQALKYQPDLANTIFNKYKNQLLSLKAGAEFNQNLVFTRSYIIQLNNSIDNKMGNSGYVSYRFNNEFSDDFRHNSIVMHRDKYFYNNSALSSKRNILLNLNKKMSSATTGLKIDGDVIVIPESLRSTVFSESVKNGIVPSLIFDINYQASSCSIDGQMRGVIKELHVYSTKFDKIHLGMLKPNATVEDGIAKDKLIYSEVFN